MNKDLSQEFIQLSNVSITQLLSCMEASGMKEKFVNDIGETKYNEIVKSMRSESTIIAMRDLHNWIKLVLISNTIKFYKQVHKQPISLLDIAIGRGGDLAKWNKSNVDYIFGFDKSDKSINSKDPEDQGALERLAHFKGSRFKDIHFVVGDAIRPSKVLLDNIDSFLNKNNLGGFNIVSCQFALHYFFKTETDLKIVLSMVSRFLLPGGFFIGTTIDGDNIKKIFKDSSSKVYTSTLFKVERKFPKTVKQPFGNEYLFTIFDSKDKANYFNTMGMSTEYLVNFKKLEEVAEEFKLRPVKLNFFEEYTLGKQKMYTETKKYPMSFTEIHNLGKWKPKSRDITQEELELNGLYKTFVFQKIG